VAGSTAQATERELDRPRRSQIIRTQLIEDERLGARHVVRLLALYLSPDNLTHAALIVCASLYASGDEWSKPDRDLAVALVSSERFAEIAREVHSRERAAA
jgi:hypothetical protein